jgi:ureidoacrylate peracid hydrolase
MHRVSIRRHIIDRMLARRGEVHWFTRLDPATTALLIIDMQDTFCRPDAPAEVPEARSIVPNINRLASRLRAMEVPVIWILHANTFHEGGSDWELFFNNVTRNADMRRRTMECLSPERQKVWQEVKVDAADVILLKNRYSALAHGASTLERVLRNRGIDTVLVGGTKTNVCCDSTARDAMMLDFKAVLVSDCCAALSDEEHLAALETFIQQFGDVLTSDEVLDRFQTEEET